MPLPFPMPKPDLRFLMQIDIEAAPRFHLGDTARGRRATDFIVGGHFEGPEIRGRVLGGIDCQLQLPDGTIPHVSIVLETEDGAFLEMHYTGIVNAEPSVMARFRAREPVNPSEYYLRTNVHFETGSEKYKTLEKRVHIGVGQPIPPESADHAVCYHIYEVV